ncbi:DUF2798 domain-containing protein [Oceanisphaera sp.]|uniref:DUF2798 domain-containing protein n=1 Tax=Oceanisphaera sp. TaxID=1929979 RepID=UPI003A90AFC7
MIARKYHRYVVAFFMSLLMSGIMSFSITTFNIDLTEQLVSRWLEAWMLGFTIAFPTVLLIGPLVYGLVELVVKEE